MLHPRVDEPGCTAFTDIRNHALGQLKVIDMRFSDSHIFFRRFSASGNRKNPEMMGNDYVTRSTGFLQPWADFNFPTSPLNQRRDDFSTGYASYGYGSIPIHTIFRGMNIHFNPAILMWTTGVLLVLTHCHMITARSWLHGFAASPFLDQALAPGPPPNCSTVGSLFVAWLRPELGARWTRCGKWVGLHKLNELVPSGYAKISYWKWLFSSWIYPLIAWWFSSSLC